MFCRVSGAGFRQLILDVAGAGAKKSVNLTFTGGQLRVQSSGIVIVEDYIDVMDQDTEYESFSTTFSNVILLIGDKMLSIMISGDTMMLVQDSLQYSVLREYTEPIEYECSKTDVRKIDSSQLNVLSKDVKAIETVMRGLGRETFDISISNCRCFIDGSCLAYEMPIQLQDMGITNKVVREVSRIAIGNWKYRVCEGVLVLWSDTKRAMVSTSVVDKQHIRMLDALPKSMRLIRDKLDLRYYVDMFETLYKIYNDSLVNITVGEEGLGVFIDNGQARISVGSNIQKLCTIQVSMQQALCLVRVMGQYNDLDVYGGDNKICLVQKSNNKKLTLAGSVY